MDVHQKRWHCIQFFQILELVSSRFSHNIRHMYIFAKIGIIIIPQENSYMGMAVSRGTLCCNIQDLLHFFWIWLCKGLSKNSKYMQTIMKMVASPSERAPRSSGFEILKGEG